MNKTTIDTSQCQTSDLVKINSLSSSISRRNKNKQPCDKLIHKLEKLTLKSIQTTKTIREYLPLIAVAKDLPIFDKSAEIEKLLKSNQVIIVAGETGCGKTTQLPKICLQAGYGSRGLIAHTQPRRVAATSVASRIADEIGRPIGETIGYSVRFSERTNAHTRVKLMTDGILLAEIQTDPMLSRYEIIIIDEAHERSLNIDFLLGFLKQLLVKRRELKVIVTSATIDPQSFSDYFNKAPVLFIEGRTYPVEVRYQPIEASQDDGEVDPILLAVQSAVDGCLAESTGDILIFSHGENEIKNLSLYLTELRLSNIVVLPLFARLGIKEQQLIFSASNKRKIIIATNVAETSLTIPNIVYVIDIGFARISRYSQRNKIQQLPIEKISQASAEQRKGRAGRICPGICIRLYSEKDYDNRAAYTEPEIKRTNLSAVVLRLKTMKVNDVELFPFLQAPQERQWKVAYNLLFELKAVNEKYEMTRIGRLLAKLPLDPQLSRILLEPKLKAVDEMLIIASFLSVREIRVRPHEHPQKADQLHSKYSDNSSDVLTVIAMWRFLQKQKSDSSMNKFRRWCQLNMINFVAWLEWRNVYFQIKENLTEMGIKVNENPAEPDEVHRSLICGFISHILMKTNEHHYQGARGLKVWIHPSSVYFKKKAAWLLSAELVETDKIYARSNMPIKPEWLETSAAHLIKSQYHDIHWRKNKGHVACFLNQTLFGLPIVNRRLIEYSKIDKIATKELFLLEGLAKDNLNQNFPFMEHNRNVLMHLQEKEEKLRSSDIQISKEKLAYLYSEVIPDSIVNVYELKGWLKKDWKRNNNCLCFDKTILAQKSVKNIEEYPAEILVKGTRLSLSYCFSPGEPEDGVTAAIPRKMLNQFSQRDFDWLVPGYLSDKILAVIKNLPKSYRKTFIPLKETADQCTKEILELDYAQLSFKQVLVDTLLKIKGIKLETTAIDLTSIPSYLLMKFRVSENSNKNLFTTEDYSTLQLINKDSNQNNLGLVDSTNKPNNSQERLTDWPNEKVSLRVETQENGHSIRMFFGLNDKRDHVRLDSFSSYDEARTFHQRGVARLILINQRRLLKELVNTWPERKELERLNLRFGGFQILIDWISLSLVKELLQSNTQEVCTRTQFETLCSQFSLIARPQISARLVKLRLLSKQMAGIFNKLSHLKSDVYQESVVEIKEQIESLWNEKIFVSLGDSFESRYSRYFAAIESRIIRIKDNFPKEKQAMENWLEWKDWWLDLNSEKHNVANQQLVNDLFWKMEEYRISLFAANIKAKGGISAKKLQKDFDFLETKLADSL